MNSDSIMKSVLDCLRDVICDSEIGEGRKLQELELQRDLGFSSLDYVTLISSIQLKLGIEFLAKDINEPNFRSALAIVQLLQKY